MSIVGDVKAAVATLVDASKPDGAKFFTGPPGRDSGDLLIVLGSARWSTAPADSSGESDRVIDLSLTISAGSTDAQQDVVDAAALDAYEALSDALAAALERLAVPGVLYARLEGDAALTQAESGPVVTKGRNATVTCVVRVRVIS